MSQLDLLQAKLQTFAEGLIDFRGQILAEKLSTLSLSLTVVIAFFAGLLTDNLFVTLYTFLAGSILGLLVVVPPWPFYNQHPVKWCAGSSEFKPVTY